MVISELWHPQGGGAELATHLYTKRILNAGLAVTIVTNRDATLNSLAGKCSVVALPFGNPKRPKPTVLLKSSSIKRKLRQLALSHDIAYLPGKLLFLAPWLKKLNASLRIIIHLHDYQFICPHSALLNFLTDETCKFIWSDFTCARCTRKYEVAHGSNFLTSFFGVATTLAWKRAADIPKILDSVDHFVTASKKQAALIASNLSSYSDEFLKKNLVLCNPTDPDIGYVIPMFGKETCLGFFGGNRYFKGLSDAIELVKRSRNRYLKLIATGMSTTPSWESNQFEFMSFLNKEQLAEVFKRVWIVLMMSMVEEPFSYVAVESQLRGRPVIATSVGGLSESIARPGFTGILIQRGKYEDFEQAIIDYSRSLQENTFAYTKEISDVSRDFFDSRTISSYNTFLKMVS